MVGRERQRRPAWAAVPCAGRDVERPLPRGLRPRLLRPDEAGSLPHRGPRRRPRALAVLPHRRRQGDLRHAPAQRRQVRPGAARRRERHPRRAQPQAGPPQRPSRQGLRAAALPARLRHGDRRRPVPAPWIARRCRRLGRCRRLPQVHPQQRLQRRPALPEPADARPARAEVRRERGPARAWRGSTRCGTPRRKTLYIQVGIGSSNEAGTFRGDHDFWRLPEADDDLTGHLNRYVAHRPVFRAAPPGAKISPNLVGRVSAAFALAAQVDAKRHPARARRELRQAKLLYAQADTASPPEELVTALPHAFYPEDAWRDDMELGAAEIALASRRLGMERSPLRARCREVGARLHPPRDRRHPQPLRHERAGACRPGPVAEAHPQARGSGDHPIAASSPTSVVSSRGPWTSPGATRSAPAPPTTTGTSTRTPSR